MSYTGTVPRGIWGFRVWNEKFPSVENEMGSSVEHLCVYNTYDYRYHPTAGECISSSGITACWSGSTCAWHVAIIEVECLDSLLHWCGLFVGREPTTDLAMYFKICISTSGITALHRLQILCLGSSLSLMRKHTICCWHVPVVSSLIHVNQKSVGTSCASNASRKPSWLTTRMRVNVNSWWPSALLS